MIIITLFIELLFQSPVQYLEAWPKVSKSYKFWSKYIDLLKIDSEGHEEYILKGSKDLLKKNQVNVIYVEILSQKNIFKSKKKKIINFLNNYGFKFIKEYPIKSVSIFSNLKSSDLLLVNENYKSE